MKYKMKSFIMAGAIIAASNIKADMVSSQFNPYLGIDYYHAWMKAKSTSGIDFDRVYPNSYPGLSFYVGNKFTENFGMEFGFDSSIRAKREWSNITPNTIITGSGKTKIRRRSFHIDLIGFVPVNESMNVLGSLGYSLMKPQIELDDMNDNETSTFKTKKSNIMRAGLGADWMLNEIAGFRAKVGWEGTSLLRIKKENDEANGPFKAFKDSMTLAVGVFFKF